MSIVTKRIITVIGFLLFGILVAIITKNYAYYVPSSLIIGILVALICIKDINK